jgi:hypothetical protein
VAVEVKTADGNKSRSDFENPRLRVDRSGYKRIAVRLPSAVSPIESLSIICQSLPQTQNSGSCRNARIVKFIRLDEKYRLVETLNRGDETRSLKSEEKLTWMTSK